MPELDTLARPITDLLSAFGSGTPGGTDPAEVIRTAAERLDTVHAACATDLGTLDRSWQGSAAAQALDRVAEAQAATAQTAERGTGIAEVVTKAYADLRTATTDLCEILESFRSFAAAAAPALGTPTGLIALVAAACEHLSRALAVVRRVHDQLAQHAMALQALVPPELPTPSGSSDAGRTEAADAHRLRSPDQSDPAAGSTGGVQVALPDGSTATAPNEAAATAVRAALAQQGVPYVWGGNTPGQGLDCSSLTKYAYGEAGIELPRLAQEQGIGHAQVDRSSLAPGDLAVWDGHVAMIVGNGQMVEAGDPVQMSPIRTENSGMQFYGFYRPTA
ncbi:C40 family peptidase [Skermania piniformis]|uniref:C40 family peptidase n=1 Tax=Skermania pinensis TaxID=39122 RepID=A0ABX8SG93_9ACTN|nr:C40 family peptidase [Skermania piniformis]